MLTPLVAALLTMGDANAAVAVKVATPSVSLAFDTGALHGDGALGRFVGVPAHPVPAHVAPPPRVVKVVAPVPAHVVKVPPKVWVAGHYEGHGWKRHYVPGHYK